jgi:hypothetical protein
MYERCPQGEGIGQKRVGVAQIHHGHVGRKNAGDADDWGVLGTRYERINDGKNKVLEEEAKGRPDAVAHDPNKHFPQKANQHAGNINRKQQAIAAGGKQPPQRFELERVDAAARYAGQGVAEED